MQSNLDSTSLRAMRRRAGLSQWKVARSLGKSQGWLSTFECGYRDLPEDLARKLVAAIKRMKGDSGR